MTESELVTLLKKREVQYFDAMEKVAKLLIASGEIKMAEAVRGIRDTYGFIPLPGYVQTASSRLEVLIEEALVFLKRHPEAHRPGDMREQLTPMTYVIWTEVLRAVSSHPSCIATGTTTNRRYQWVGEEQKAVSA